MKFEEYSLGLGLSFDTHIDELLAGFFNVNKSHHLFTSLRHKQKNQLKQLDEWIMSWG